MVAQPTPHARWTASIEPYVPVPELPDDAIRLAFNESFLGPFPVALEAIATAAARAGRYPERDGRLISRLAEHHGLAPEMIALGNGADAIIGYLSTAFLRSGDEVITGWPSFPTYVVDALKQEATIVTTPLRDGAFDLDAIADRIGPRTRLVWVCTPNNPTGATVSRAAFGRFVEAVPERVLIVVDEAYHEFSAAPDQLDAIAEHVLTRPNVAALRTFSKLYGLAGLRVGYLAAPAAIVEAVGKGRHYYDVSDLASRAALVSLDCPQEVSRRRAANDRGRARLRDGLERLGLTCLPSRANFVAVDVGDADATARRLLDAGVATRSLSGLGAPELLRVTVGSDAQIDLLLELLSARGRDRAARSLDALRG